MSTEDERLVSELGDYLFLHWPLDTQPDVQAHYDLARVVIRGGWRR